MNESGERISMGNSGIVVIHKEKGFTSHDVVAIVKRILKIKAGHTGTLDPQAEGVLPVCVGTSTRLAGYLTADDKVYIAKVRLGMTTDTGDDIGEILTRGQAAIGDGGSVMITREKIISAVASFEGEQLQTPPMYSAIKVNGKRLYELARKGKTVEREPRRIFISSIKVLAFFPEEQSFTMEVTCSKGTYIRSLCADIGEKLGCGACMGDLLRTRSGIFTLGGAVKLGALSINDLLRPEDALPYPKAVARPEAAKLVLNGNPVPRGLISFLDTDIPADRSTPSDKIVSGVGSSDEKYWLYFEGTLRGLYTPKAGRLIPEVML